MKKHKNIADFYIMSFIQVMESSTLEKGGDASFLEQKVVQTHRSLSLHFASTVMI